MNASNRIEFWCSGVPRPQGSKRAMVNRKTGRAFLIEDSKRLKPWRKQVAEEARLAVVEQGAIDAKMWRVELAFFFARPKSHVRVNGELKDWAVPLRPTGKPDCDKLTRAIFDAITNIAITDDAAVVSSAQDKFYTLGTPGVRVVIKAAKGSTHG